MNNGSATKIGKIASWSFFALIAYGPVFLWLFSDAKLPVAYWIFGAILALLCALPLSERFWRILGSQIWGLGIVIVLFYWTAMLGWERDNPQPVQEMIIAAAVILGGFALWQKFGSSEDDS